MVKVVFTEMIKLMIENNMKTKTNENLLGIYQYYMNYGKTEKVDKTTLESDWILIPFKRSGKSTPVMFS